MKTSQRLVVVVEGLLFVVLAFLINIIFPEEIDSQQIVLKFGLALLVFYSFRRGPVAGIIAGIGLGILNVLFHTSEVDSLFLMIIGTAAVGLSGLFARNLQRTLHNRRLKSTYLNLVTGVLVAMIVYFAVRFVVVMLAIDTVDITRNISQNSFSFLVNTAFVLILMIVILNTTAKHFIPKNTPYISRKERSRLLND